MDLKTFVKRYVGCKVTYKRKGVQAGGVLASGHQQDVVRNLVLKGVPYKDMAYKALGFLIYEDELTHDQAVKMIRKGEQLWNEINGD